MTKSTGRAWVSTSKKARRGRGKPNAAAGNRGAIQIKISLEDIEPEIWRRVVVPGDFDLYQVHLVVQDVMSWDDSHLHQFRVGRTVYTDTSSNAFAPDMMWGRNRGASEDGVLLRDVAKRVGSKIVYEYDFGDSWQHLIVVERIVRAGEGEPVVCAVCLDGARAGPPEDCGGAWGYADMLEAIADPEHEDHEERMEWLGDGFDPEKFDRTAVNERLARIR
jgi:hypothetical protein